MITSMAFCETKTILPTKQDQKWNSIEEIIAELAVQPAQTIAQSNAQEGDPRLLQELLDQGDREIHTKVMHHTTASMTHANLLAAR
jgi:tripartite-type tricarboxylate transporter receptor subunit TctC